MPLLQRQNSCDIIYYYSILFYVGVMTIIVSHKVCACVSWNLNDYRLYIIIQVQNICYIYISYHWIYTIM